MIAADGTKRTKAVRRYCRSPQALQQYNYCVISVFVTRACRTRMRRMHATEKHTLQLSCCDAESTVHIPKSGGKFPESAFQPGRALRAHTPPALPCDAPASFKLMF